MKAYYNEFDPYAAQWLRNLIAAGLIMNGDVDERSIKEVSASDLAGYRQCHFFAGLGGWSRAMRLAGWPDERPAWTGSCPCQPFSAAGKGKAFDDDRHLWPEWYRLIAECDPSVIFGEQVDASIKWGWLDLVQDDLSFQGYSFGAAVLPAAGVGAPHIRHRTWFVADKLGDTFSTGLEGLPRYGNQRGGQEPGRSIAEAGYAPCGLADAYYDHRQPVPGGVGEATGGTTEDRADIPVAGASGRAEHASGGLDNSICDRRGAGRNDNTEHDRQQSDTAINPTGAGPVNGFWGDADWLLCRDGKWRPVRPGTFVLAHGVPARVGRLRAFGNAIEPHTGAAFIKAYMLTGR